MAPARAAADHRFVTGIARAFGGAIIFALPLFMTMEMWWLGFHMDRFRLALLLLVLLPVLAGLSYFTGFEESTRRVDDVVHAFIAYAVGFVAAALILTLFGLIEPGMPLDEIVGKIALQAVPASIGAVLARSLLGGGSKLEQDKKRRRMGYAGETFLMTVGALFLAFNVAPTEEMVLIAYIMTEWHVLALALLSLVLMHAFVFAVQFHGQADLSPETPWWSAFIRFTGVGYVIALLISAYVLWSFGRTEGVDFAHIVSMTVVLGFPAAIGAAAARLIL
ncbi:MAG: TIGR02587 family membrane protein [Gammaproteobacteria bacterium]